MPDTVRSVLARRCTEAARPALIEGATGRFVTWAEVASGVGGWDDLPADEGTRIGLAVGDPLSMAANYLSALAAGVTIAPLNPDGAPGELARQAGALGLRAVVTDAGERLELAAAMADAGCALWAAGECGPRPARGGWGSAVPRLPAGAALVMASSGTTGAPKVIPLAESQLLHTARGVACHLGLDADRRGFSPLPLWHINGLVVGVLAAAVAGSSLIVDRRFSRRRFWRTVEEHHPTWLNLVPAVLSVLAAAEENPPAGHRIRLTRSASAPLPEAVRRRFEDRFGIPIVETYGMTEAASQITANPLGARRPGSVGLPVGLEVRVVDEEGRAAGDGVVGRVQIRGKNVTDTYWAAAGAVPAARPALLPGGWLPTGDVGHLDPDGYLWLIGRDDDVINRGGEKVQPREVEEVLVADSRVAAAVVVGRPHPTVGQEPVAYILAPGEDDAATLAAALARRCGALLSRHKQPAEIIVLDAMPAGPTGKPRRSELRRLAAAAEAGPGLAAPA